MSNGAIIASTTATTAAAAAAAERLRKEEEGMTEYTREELDEDWEFKIVRANTPAFRNPERLRRLIEEEARAGWVMVEKFDDQRVRFKRQRSAREQDAMLPPDVDPYRTQYGALGSQVVIGLVIGLILLALLGGLVLLLMVSGG
jgi:uncharacterized iron-regulated membrane protein